MACLQIVYLYVTQPYFHTLMQTRLSANQSTRTRENYSRMNDWLQNRITFILFYSIYIRKIQNSSALNLMGVIHEIAWEIIILKIQPKKLKKKITYFSGDIKSNLFQYYTGQYAKPNVTKYQGD